MLRIIAICSNFTSADELAEGYELLKHQSRLTVRATQLPLLASFLAGCWLSQGFRDPTLFGVAPPMPIDSELYLSYFQSCRIIFENLLSG